MWQRFIGYFLVERRFETSGDRRYLHHYFYIQQKNEQIFSLGVGGEGRVGQDDPDQIEPQHHQCGFLPATGLTRHVPASRGVAGAGRPLRAIRQAAEEPEKSGGEGGAGDERNGGAAGQVREADGRVRGAARTAADTPDVAEEAAAGEGGGQPEQDGRPEG